MEVSVSAAIWVVRKALAPVTDGLLEAWAASSQLGPNVTALKMGLLYAQAMLNNSHGREIRNPALKQMLDELRQQAYRAEDVLDELDYYRIHDSIKGTNDAADADGVALNARHTARDAVKRLGLCFCPRDDSDTEQQVTTPRFLCCAGQAERGNADRPSKPAQGGVRKFALSARRTVCAVGKHLACCPSRPVGADAPSAGMSDLARPLAGKESVVDSPKLKFYRVEMSARMKDIVDNMKQLCAEVSTILNLDLLDSNRCIAQDIAAALLVEREHRNFLQKYAAKSPPTTISEMSEPNFCGREDEVKKIKQDITKGEYRDNDLTVLPIVGHGGMGKTTLAQFIYKEVESYFEVKIWICVSLNFSVDRLTREIVKFIPPVQNEQSGNPEKLIEQRIKSKRFLLVLDDMWPSGDKDEWNRLLAPLRKGQTNGNVILVTTRSPVVAQMVKTTDNAIDLDGLDEEAFRNFFKSCVFGNEQPENQTELVEIGEKIMKKLKGSPLAAKTVGRLLRNQLSEDHWMRVLESKEWQLQTGDHDIIPALKLSYDYLPFHLQQCFSYCSLFPEDYKFGSEELIYWWVGLDIVHSDGQNKSIEDIGQSYLDELVSHGFLKKDDANGTPCYVMHDLLHDLALRVASRECLSLDCSNVQSVEIWPTIRHLSIIIDDSEDSDGVTGKKFISELRKLKTRLKVENLQTLMIFGVMDASFAEMFGDLFRTAGALRVLRLSSMPSPVESMLHKFSDLLHLRYLRLESTSISKMSLPSALSRFYHLKILDIQAWEGSPDLPRDMSNLRKSCHFLTRDDEVHSIICEVGQLQFLQELKRFIANKETSGFELKQLKNLAELRELGIYNLEKISTNEEAVEANLADKNYLFKLTLHWDTGRPKIERDVEGVVLEKLQPHRNLRELCIGGHGSRSCPTWLLQLSVKSLHSLHLVGVDWENFPPLGCMRMLEELTLKDLCTVKEFGPGLFGSTTERKFPNLKKLTVIGLKGLENWALGLGDTSHLLSQLQVLIVRDCPELLGLPFSESICCTPIQEQEGKIQWFSELQKLEVENCPKVKSVPPIPWTQRLCSVEIRNTGSEIIEELYYSKSSSRVKLRITGKDGLRSLHEDLLVFSNLKDLQALDLTECPPLELKHLRILESLKGFVVFKANHVFVPSNGDDEVKSQLPIESLWIARSNISAEELTQFLYHLPRLSVLTIRGCEKIKRLGIEVDTQKPTAPKSLPPSSVIKMEHTEAAYCQQEIAAEVEEQEELEDGLLVFPAHLSDSLRALVLQFCRKLSLVAPLPNECNKAGRGWKGGLQALRSLQGLEITYCPKLLSTYTEAMRSSSCFPFPSSLRKFRLQGKMEGMETLEPLSNLSSLVKLHIYDVEDLRGEGLWTLVTQGSLSELTIKKCPQFFVGWHPTPGLQAENQEQLPSKLQELETDDAAVLAAPFLTLLSSSLTMLSLNGMEIESFAKEQEEALQLVKSLQCLQFSGCHKLQCLPAGLHMLPNLKEIQISYCPAVSSLPKDGLPNSLRKLDVRYCNNNELKEQCRKFVRKHPRVKLI